MPLTIAIISDMFNIEPIFDRAEIPSHTRVRLICELWRLLRIMAPEIEQRYSLVIWPTPEGLIEVDLLPRPVFR